ncbi:hypothetical protein GCM10009846_13680 [Agrococcus versicolor]|uniref:Aerotolerance regulator N-terminal domain-containing protein n=1 Tax=Agrococcus versicolor TaxID=501482 RepID=A0ABP5MET3_9MICO
MFDGPYDTLIVLLLVVPTLVLWIVTQVRVSRAKDPRDHDGRRMEVDGARLLVAQRRNRLAVLLLSAACVLAFALRILV